MTVLLATTPTASAGPVRVVAEGMQYRGAEGMPAFARGSGLVHDRRSAGRRRPPAPAVWRDVRPALPRVGDVVTTRRVAARAAVAADTITVNAAGDAGDPDVTDGLCDTNPVAAGITCTLRAAIEEANWRAGTDTIAFALGAGAVIKPQSALPAVTAPVTIDGTTQPGYQGVPVVELSGVDTGAGAHGLHITAGASTVRGLAITGFRGTSGPLTTTGSAIALRALGANTIAGNYLGVAPDGSTDRGNQNGVTVLDAARNVLGGPADTDRNVISGNVVGVGVTGDAAVGNRIVNNRIGTTAAGDAALGNDAFGVLLSRLNERPDETSSATEVGDNVISGNHRDGLVIGFSPDNVIEGNQIGTDATGTYSLGNGRGIRLENAPGNAIGSNPTAGSSAAERNLVSGNLGDGIAIAGVGADDTQVLGNWIGTTGGGLAALPNDGDGIAVTDEFGGGGAGPTRIGGPGPGDGNVISGNGRRGVTLARASGSTLQGNLIGTDRTGAVAVPNQAEGVVLGFGTGIKVGGDADGEGNVISGNLSHGLRLRHPPLSASAPLTADTVVAGNLIGAARIGATPLGNGGHGISVEDDVRGTIIGVGDADSIVSGCAGACNMITRNSGDGLHIADQSDRTTARGNQIVRNDELGIDLGADGPTPNDVGDSTTPADGDTGPNGLQNFPVGVLATTDPLSGKRTISGVVEAPDPAAVIVDVYGSSTVDASGFGEARVPIASDHPSAAGRFAVVLPDGVSFPYYTATATSAAGETSEFSPVCGGRTLAGVPDDTVPADSDGDALCDDWERRGGIDYDADGQLDLQLNYSTWYGPDGPVVGLRDVFVEVDAMTGMAPGTPAIEDVQDAYRRSPVGARLHVTPWDASGVDDDPIPLTPTTDFDGAADKLDSFRWLKSGRPVRRCDGHFGPRVDRHAPDCATRLGARRLIYRYAAWVRRIEDNPTDAGVTEVISGNDMLVARGFHVAPPWTVELVFEAGAGGPGPCNNPDECRNRFEAAAFMHELGHSLGLHHGGPGDDVNYKPNQLSIMNYSYLFANLSSGRKMDYARWALPVLRDDALDETVGIESYDGLPPDPDGPVFDPQAWPEVVYAVPYPDIRSTAPFDPTFVGTCVRAVSRSAGSGWVDWNNDGAKQAVRVRARISGAKAGECLEPATGQVLASREEWSKLRYSFRDLSGFDEDGPSPGSFPDSSPGSEEIEAGARTADADADGTVNAEDNCNLTANADQADADGDGTGDACLPLIAERDLAVKLARGSRNLVLGQERTVTVTVTDDWPVAASGAVVAVDVPAPLELLGATPESGSWDATTRRWTVGTVPAHGQSTLALRVRGTAMGSTDVHAELLAADRADPDSTPANHNPIEDDEVAARLNVVASAETPALSVADVRVEESDEDDRELDFVLRLSAPYGGEVSLEAATADGTATSPADYESVSRRVVFAPGVTEQHVAVAVRGDLAHEADETMTLDLSDVDGALAPDPRATGTIVDDDEEILLSVTDVAAREGDQNDRELDFVLRLSAPYGGEVSVHAQTADGTAAAPGDYESVRRSVLFAPGVTEQHVAVSVHGDQSDEDDETLTLALSAVDGATAPDLQATGTIVDDDGQPPSDAAHLDPSFAGDGTLTIPESVPGGLLPAAVALQGDKPVLAGTILGPAGAFIPPRFAVTRLTEAGTPDSSFANTNSLLGTERAEARAVAVQPDGRIVAAGYRRRCLNTFECESDIALMRLLPNGAPDPTFGNAGVVITDLAADESAHDVAVQPDGMVVVAASLKDSFTALRYQADGVLDPTFGGIPVPGARTVFVENDPAQALSGARAIELLPNGRVLLFGSARAASGEFQPALVGLTAAGAPDGDFATSGIRRLDFGSAGALGRDVVVFRPPCPAQPCPARIAAAASRTDTTLGGFGTALLSADGELQKQGTDGFAGAGSVNEGVEALAADGEGRLIAAGWAHFDEPAFALVRLESDLQRDLSFGEAGRLSTGFGGREFASDVTVDPQGRIVVVGSGADPAPGGARYMAVARYLPASTDSTPPAVSLALEPAANELGWIADRAPP